MARELRELPRNLHYVAMACALALACGRAPLLAEGPLELSSSPVTIVVPKPNPPADVTWELCFEFDPPGESLRAVGIHVTFVEASGVRQVLEAPEVDRRGESTVCLVGRAGIAAQSLELTAEDAVRVQAIRGSARP